MILALTLLTLATALVTLDYAESIATLRSIRPDSPTRTSRVLRTAQRLRHHTPLSLSLSMRLSHRLPGPALHAASTLAPLAPAALALTWGVLAGCFAGMAVGGAVTLASALPALPSTRNTDAPQTPDAARTAGREHARNLDLDRWDLGFEGALPEVAHQHEDMAVSRGLPERLADEYGAAFLDALAKRVHS